MPFATTNDGVRLWYDDAGDGRPLVMIHGWGASPEFFDRNRDPLATELRVVRMAYRGHYKSDKPRWGHHIARYAKDVKDLIEYLTLEDVTLLGWSMGCSIIWSYYELFGDAHLSGVILVDQTPRQYLEFGGQNWRCQEQNRDTQCPEPDPAYAAVHQRLVLPGGGARIKPFMLGEGGVKARTKTETRHQIFPGYAGGLDRAGQSIILAGFFICDGGHNAERDGGKSALLGRGRRNPLAVRFL